MYNAFSLQGYCHHFTHRSVHPAVQPLVNQPIGPSIMIKDTGLHYDINLKLSAMMHCAATSFLSEYVMIGQFQVL